MKVESEIMIEKNKEYIVDIIDNGYDGEGIAKIENFTIFIKNAIKGEKCKILIVKVNKSFAYGKILEIISTSENRKEPDCSTYKRCGGCDLRHIDYGYTLKMKQDIVQNLVNKSLNNKVNVLSTIGMKNPYYYRNKLQYPIGKDKNGKLVQGIFAKRTHDIIQVEDCLIQNKEAQKIVERLIEIMNEYGITAYDEKSGKGIVRHIVVKVGIYTNEIMCIIVTNEENIKNESIIVKQIIEEFK